MDFALKLLHLILVEFLATWPIVLGIVAIAYRKQFANFLERAIEIGPGGAKAVPPSLTQQIPSPTSFAITGETGHIAITGDTAAFTGTVENRPAESGLSLPPPDPVLADTERTILEHLKERRTDHLNTDDQKKFFVREYAQLWIISQFQAIGLQIYGTQIALLRHLDNSPPQSQAALIPIFEDHKKRVAEAGIKIAPDFYNWIAFMLNTKLVAVNSDGLYSITPLGKQFLHVYAPAFNLTEATRLF